MKEETTMKLRYQLSIFIIVLLFIFTNANSQLLETKSLSPERGYEPVEIEFDTTYFDTLDLAYLSGIPTSQLFLYSYHSGSGWVPIPFQIDEDYEDPFIPSNDVIDSTDVLIFLGQDLGDKVTLGNWIDNEDSRSNKRFEIEIVDFRDRTKKGWCYLFVSSTLTEQDKSPIKYLSIDIDNDKVISSYYQLDYFGKWYPENVKITLQGGGNNQDFYDRTKIRFIMLLGGTFWQTLLEDDLAKPPDSTIQYTPNPVIRLKRKIPLELFLGGQSTGRKVNFSMTYYPFSTVFSGEIGLDQFIGLAGVKAVRMSYDLNSNGNGMHFFSGDSVGVRNQDKLIDGTNNLDNVDTSLVKNSKNWTMVTGAQGTMLSLNNVRYESNPPAVQPEPHYQYLYYWDNINSSTLPLRTVDPANDWDTGDSLSYGDCGMVFESYALTDSIHYISTTYFIGGNQTVETAQHMFYNFNAPLKDPSNINIRFQDYVTNVELAEDNHLPAGYRLKPNFPNPFNPRTTITFELPKNDNVSLQIFDIQGKHIITLVNKKLNAGVHNYIWNGRDKDNNLVTSGIYFCTIRTDTFRASQKMAFVK